MHKASQYPLGEELSVLDPRIAPPAVCSIDGASVLRNLLGSESVGQFSSIDGAALASHAAAPQL